MNEERYILDIRQKNKNNRKIDYKIKTSERSPKSNKRCNFTSLFTASFIRNPRTKQHLKVKRVNVIISLKQNHYP